MSGYRIGMAEEAVITDLTAKLVESQAREAKLREALKVLMSAPFDYPDDEYQQDKLAAAMSNANKLLNKPHDDTALEEYRKKVLLEAEQKCPACGGNDGDMPCAYPGEHEQQPGCLRAAYSRGQTLKGNEMTSLCENEHCAYHRPLPVKDAGAPYVDTVEDGERVRVERYLYRSRDGKRDFFLCDICHAAVQMVVTPNAEVTGA